MGCLPFFSKRPADKIVVGLDFSDEVPEGVTIISGSCSARKFRDESDATSTLLSNGTTSTIDVDKNHSKIVIAGGVAGTMYEVLFNIVLSVNAQTRQGLARVFVEN